MATIDQQFVEYIVKTLVNNPDKVSVERHIDEKGVLLSLTVDPEDIGRIIGRRGATAQSIRTLLRALGTKNNARYNLKIANADDSFSRRSYRSEYRDDFPPAVREERDYSFKDESESEKEDFDEEEQTSELAEKTRAELADLDDLDI